MPIRAVLALCTAAALAAALSGPTRAQAPNCTAWTEKRGYAIDYVIQRAGKRQPCGGEAWRGNVTSDEIEPGDVAIFREPRGHLAMIEEVDRDTYGKPVLIVVSDFNRPGAVVDQACGVTEWFGKESRYRIGAEPGLRYWRPTR